MKTGLISLVVMGAAGALTTAGASAQGIDLTGQYHCVQNCKGPGPVYVTQHGWDLLLVNEAGQPRGLNDWPGHIWAQFWNEGAVVSPDGLTIQFDDGTVWRRDLPPLRARG